MLQLRPISQLYIDITSATEHFIILCLKNLKYFPYDTFSPFIFQKLDVSINVVLIMVKHL